MSISCFCCYLKEELYSYPFFYLLLCHTNISLYSRSSSLWLLFWFVSILIMLTHAGDVSFNWFLVDLLTSFFLLWVVNTFEENVRFRIRVAGRSFLACKYVFIDFTEPNLMIFFIPEILKTFIQYRFLVIAFIVGV